MSEKIRFAVVGLGHIGKRHVQMIQRNSECELKAICDIKSLEKLSLDDVKVPFFSSLDALLEADLEVDVVCICTPNGLHAKQAISVLDAQKHVVIEKPMGLSKAECEAVIFKSLNVSKRVFCVMQNRYSPPSLWLKEVIEEKKLGEIFQVQINCYWNRDERYYYPKGIKHDWKGDLALDGGVLFTQFAHFIDILYWLFGDVADIQAKFHNFAHQNITTFEDTGLVNFRFVNGGVGCLNYSTAVWGKNLESSMTVIGSKGSLKIGGQYMNEVEYCHIDDYEMPALPPTNPANDYGAYKGSAANHVYVFKNVVDVLKGRKAITTNALEGMKVVEIIERIYLLKQ